MLKVFDVSPLTHVMVETFPFLPQPYALLILGIAEVAIGGGILIPKLVRFALIGLWMQMVGVFLMPLLNPPFFNNNIMILTLEGQFVLKNLILIAGSIVLWKSLEKH